MAGRTHGHTEGLHQPHLMQWVLKQETPRKQVLLQIFSGTPERECARRMHMTLEQVQQVERWAADEGPTFVEDDYVMAYYGTKSREEFCRVTGQGGGVYRLMELRYPKEKARGTTGGDMASRGGGAPRPASSSVRVSHVGSAAKRDDEAARGRREECAAARERERARRTGEDAFETPVPKAKLTEKLQPSTPVAATRPAPRVASTRPAATAKPAQHAKPAAPAKAPAPKRPVSATMRLVDTNEERRKQLAVMTEAACKRCASAYVRPVTFSAFLEAFRRECLAAHLTSEVVPGSAVLRRMLVHDDRVMWVGAESFWFFDWKTHARSIRQVIEHTALMDREYSARLFYRKSRPFMRRLGIKTPDELYEILRRVYVDADDDAVFGNHLSFGFGKIDRRRQVWRFVSKHPGEPKSVLAMDYEREFGFSAGTAEIWIDLFARPEDVSLSEWIEREDVGPTTPAAEPTPVASTPELPEKPAEPAPKPAVREESPKERPDWVLEELVAASVPYVDKRPRNGCLWVREAPGLSEVLRRLRAQGARFRYTAGGGRATRYKPGWWLSGYPHRTAVSAADAKAPTAVEEPIPTVEQTADAVGAAPLATAATPEAGARLKQGSQSEVVEPEPAEPEMPEPEAEALTVQGFLARELTGDICDASLVRARFAYEFLDEPDVTKDVAALSGAGYYEDRGLLFRCGRTPNEHFTRLLSSHPSFSKGDPGFEGIVWKHPTFRYVLRGALADHRVLLYEQPDSYISFSRLHDVLGTRMADVEGYAPAVAAAVPERTPFSISSLRGTLGFTHPLDGLDMPDAFYEGLLSTSDLFQGCTMAGTRVFETGVEQLSANTFLEWIVAGHEGIAREDVPRLLAKEYGIDYPMASLVTAIYNSDVYHDDVGDAYYSSMEAWKKEARNALAD